MHQHTHTTCAIRTTAERAGVVGTVVAPKGTVVAACGVVVVAAFAVVTADDVALFVMVVGVVVHVCPQHVEP
jgi:hypothetical protein